jgi:hypothetical protein
LTGILTTSYVVGATHYCAVKRDKLRDDEISGDVREAATELVISLTRIFRNEQAEECPSVRKQEVGVLDTRL